MRKKVIAGNWKMNNDLAQMRSLIAELSSKMPNTTAEIIIAPSYVVLAQAVELTKGSPIVVAAQNMHFAPKGAYTGEISASMLQSIGVSTVILGHSERREYYNETDEALAKKVDTALSHQMKVIFCIGEKLEQRKGEKHFEVVKQQIEKALFHLPASAWANIILAYEPVWAIGTGETATPAQAQQMHAFIRQVLTEKYGEALAQSVSILYGGSCNAKNASELFKNQDVDGGLIGGASLLADDFVGVINGMK